MNLEINKELVLSSCHVEKGELDLIDEDNFSSDECNTRLCVEMTLEGFGDKYPTSSNLKKCLDLAESLGCKWLVLDRDGPTVEFLEKFN